MAKLLITTQYMENYGAHDWDGTGECPQYWKSKGGNDYVIKKFKGDPTTAVMAVRGQIESDNDYTREHVLWWKVVADDYLTEFERDQMEYEGKITFPAQELAWS